MADKPKIRFAPRLEVHDMEKLADQFLEVILDCEGAFITDESWLTDFIDFTLEGEAYEQEKERIWALIEELYGVDVRPEVCIVKILRRIQEGK